MRDKLTESAPERTWRHTLSGPEVEYVRADLIAKLTAERDAWRQLVIEHNAECKRLCETYACGYRKYVERVGRHCSNCHLDYQIDIPAELEQPT